MKSVLIAPPKKVHALPSISSEDKTVIKDFNDTLSYYPVEKTLVDLFEDQVEKNPEGVALIQNDQKITYGELNVQVNKLARYLVKHGAHLGSHIGLLTSRGFDMITGMLAILKTGASYIPIDPEYPVERQEYILNQSAASMVVADGDFPLMDKLTISYINIKNTNQRSFSKKNLNITISSRQLAYTIFTSGSTGQPKGVMIEHHSAVNLISWVNKEFNIDKTDRMLFITSMCFDLSVYDIFGILAAGGTVVIATQQDVSDVRKLKRLLKDFQITFWDSVPTTMNYMVREIDSHQKGYVQDSLRLVFLSGDWIPLTLPDSIKKYFPNARVISLGGATEGTVWSNFFPIDQVNPAWPSIPYGKPIANNFFYVLDEQLHQVPIGRAGELFIGGVGVARGYANDDEKTSYSFIPDPFNKQAGGMMYRTGDLGKLLPDGNMEFLGRKDTQVKIRGYRVELGEIESVLNQSGLANQAIVVVRENQEGTKNLIAFIVPHGDFFDRTVILSYLRNKLPEYMIPTILVDLKEFPLTSNGKIDKKALLEMDVLNYSAIKYSPPVNQIQLMLVDKWQEILGREKVGIHDNFFELGGHSLTALRLLTNIKDTLGIPLTIRDLFLHQSIESLAKHIESAGASRKYSEIIPIDIKPEYIPLSFNQESMWFIDQLKSSLQYHIPRAFRINGPIDTNALTYALHTIVERHETLRTVFRKTDGRPYQQVLLADKWKISFVDAVKLDQNAGFLNKTIMEILNVPFDLANDYMLRASLIRLTEDDHILIINLHHIASDGRSATILIREMMMLYESFISSKKAAKVDDQSLTALKLQYSDFSIWQRSMPNSKVLQKNITYWKAKLKNTDPLILPTDHNRPTVQSNRGEIVNFEIDRSLMSQLNKLSRQEGVTLFMSLLAAFKVMLYRYSQQNDICVGTAVSGREHKEIENLIGYFINTLVLRTVIDENGSFLKLLHDLKSTTLDAFEHQAVSFDQVVASISPDRNLGTNPLFQVMFILQNQEEIKELQLGKAHLSETAIEHKTAKFDLSFVITGSDDSMTGLVEYSTDLYEQATIQKMIDHYIQLLRSAVSTPEEKVIRLNMLSPYEEDQLLSAFNQTNTAFPEEKSLADLFIEQVRKSPDQIALIFENEQWTYRQLSDRANQLAFYLQSKGVKEDQIIPVYMDKSAEMIVAIFGILISGAAFAPVSPGTPFLRLKQILRDIDAKFIICGDINISQLQNEPGMEIIKLNPKLSFLDDLPSTDVKNELHPHHLAYVIYTSGTTGKPKGILIEHRAIVNYVVTSTQEISIPENTGSGSFVHLSFSFDASLASVFIPLLSGRSIVLSSGMAAEAFKDDVFLRHAPYDFIALTPSHLPLISEAIKGNHKLIAYNLLIGGEPLQAVHLDFLAESHGQINVYNEYGPSETTISCVSFPFILTDLKQHITGKIPIGSPKPNTQAFILNPDRGLVPVGVAGELYIGGVGLAREYLNMPDVTGEKFVPNPFRPGMKMYASGDICRWLPDGNIEFLERKDDQVKIRGHRIELAEIQGTLQECELVKNSVVVLIGDDVSSKRLAAYVQPNGIFNSQAMTHFLKDYLPDYMIPALWMEIDHLPLNQNGKVDKSALPGFDAERKQAFAAPVSEKEKALADIWREALGLQKVGIRDNFFELGGHSLMAVQIMTKTEAKLGKKLPLSILFKYPTIESLVEFLEKEGPALENFWQSLVPIKASGNKMPVYIIHGSGLNVLNFNHIAMHVNPEQPVYGLQAKGLNGDEEALDDMKLIAASYIKEITDHNPSGPYAIAGYSFGGYVAVEMRNQLEAMGRKVTMLAMFDTNAVESEQIRKWPVHLVKKVARQIPKFIWIMKSLFTRPASTISYQTFLIKKFVNSAGKKFRKSEQVHVGPFFSQLDKINEKHWQAFNNYELKPFNDQVYLFRAMERVYYVNDFKYLGWSKYAQKGVRIYEVPGNHKTMLLPPNAYEFGQALQHALDNCHDAG